MNKEKLKILIEDRFENCETISQFKSDVLKLIDLMDDYNDMISKRDLIDLLYYELNGYGEDLNIKFSYEDCEIKLNDYLSKNKIKKINNNCEWKYCDFGMMGFHDYEYVTSCGKNYDSDKINKENYCPNCGGKII